MLQTFLSQHLRRPGSPPPSPHKQSPNVTRARKSPPLPGSPELHPGPLSLRDSDSDPTPLGTSPTRSPSPTRELYAHAAPAAPKSTAGITGVWWGITGPPTGGKTRTPHRDCPRHCPILGGGGPISSHLTPSPPPHPRWEEPPPTPWMKCIAR